MIWKTDLYPCTMFIWSAFSTINYKKFSLYAEYARKSHEAIRDADGSSKMLMEVRYTLLLPTVQKASE